MRTDPAQTEVTQLEGGGHWKSDVCRLSLKRLNVSGVEIAGLEELIIASVLTLSTLAELSEHLDQAPTPHFTHSRAADPPP